MGYEDRSYYRDSSNGPRSPLMWLLEGSVPLFTIFGIRVRAHASLILLIALSLLLGVSNHDSVAMRVQSMTGLFVVILLHEFGHCFAARATGGEANDIMMTPLGGLAMAMARRKPWPTFLTIAGGPAVNVAICLICGLGMLVAGGRFPLTPWSVDLVMHRTQWFSLWSYCYWIYALSFALLCFNLLPVYPLDGGQLLQSILWKPMGYYKSMILTMNIGLGGALLLAMVGIATFGSIGGGLLLIAIAAMCFMNCLQTRAMLRAEGPWAFSEEDMPDHGNLYAAAHEKSAASSARKVKRESDRIAKRADRIAREEATERQSIDAILAKVSSQGMQSLTSSEQKVLRTATERQRARDTERAKSRR